MSGDVNEAMFPAPRTKLNTFTHRLRRKCGLSKSGLSMVKLRNETFVDVSYLKPEDDCDDGGFMKGDYDMLWNADGSCLTSSDFDIVGI